MNSCFAAEDPHLVTHVVSFQAYTSTPCAVREKKCPWSAQPHVAYCVYLLGIVEGFKLPICDTFPWLCLRGWFNKQLPCQKGGPERIHFPALYCLYTTPAAPNWRFPTSFIASNHMAASQSYMKLQYISIHQHTLTIISLSLRLPRFNCSIWSIRCHRCFPNGWNTDICVQWISAVTMASIVSVPRGSVDRWGSMNLWHWNLWNKSGTESKQYLLNLLPFRSKNLCFDPFWSILNMAGAASPQRQPLERLLDRRMQSVWLPCYCGNMWKQRQAVSAILIHSAILPRDQQIILLCHAVPGVHFCLLSCQCGFHWPNSQRNTALAWVSCCFLNIDKQNQKSRNMQKLMNHFKFILNSFILIICDMFFRSFQISWTLRLSTWPEMMPEAILFPARNTALDVPLSIALCKYTYFILLFKYFIEILWNRMNRRG